MLWIKRALSLIVLVTVATCAAVVLVYFTIPAGNTTQTHFDTIIVLGCPARLNGTPSPEGRERTLEGVREYRAGVAPHILFTGGAAHNHLVEARVLAQFAESHGVPASAIVEEGQAQDTIQNAYYSVQIMQQNGWNSAEVVSSPSHLRRASLIFRHFPVLYHTHAAHWPPEYSLARILTIWYGEATYTAHLRVFGFRHSRFLPAQ
jgi:uncharacterized SAM-binding protein YcdF (DUF218 family)